MDIVDCTKNGNPKSFKNLDYGTFFYFSRDTKTSKARDNTLMLKIECGLAFDCSNHALFNAVDGDLMCLPVYVQLHILSMK